MADKIKPSTPVRATTHPGDTRSNIPTAELESFARPEEKRPAIVRYPRNPDLDLQLVWKGKDEQDSHDLEVPAVPIYIQETIDPLALVEELRAESQGRQPEASRWVEAWNGTSRLTVPASVPNVTVLIFPAVHHVVDWRGYLFPVIR